MAAQSKLYKYDGPSVLVVEAGVEVGQGDYIYGSDALGAVAGFTEVKSLPKSKDAVNSKDDGVAAQEAVFSGGQAAQTQADIDAGNTPGGKGAAVTVGPAGTPAEAFDEAPEDVTELPEEPAEDDS
jgi:hypothetical protein